MADAGALRSRLVAGLTGLTARQLGYWHQTGLIEAHADPGARGYPRLYSWIDYMKLRAAARLRAEGVPTNRIREAVEYLERMETDWHLLPLRAEGKSVLARLNSSLRVVADQGGQIPLDEGLKKTLRKTLRAIRAEGPLGELSDFSDAVDMNPRVRGGAPVIRRTRIETAFISSLHHEMGRKPAAIAVAYQLSELFVRRAVEFEEAAA